MPTMKCPRCESVIVLRKHKKTVCFECGWQSGVRTKQC